MCHSGWRIRFGGGLVADAGILARLAVLGITGQRATDLADAMDPTQVAATSDQLLRVMVEGRESGDATDHGHVYPDGHVYPS